VVWLFVLNLYGSPLFFVVLLFFLFLHFLFLLLLERPLMICWMVLGAIVRALLA